MRNRFDQLKTSVALYTDDSYRINDRLIVRGGLRFTHDNAIWTTSRARHSEPTRS